MKLNIFFISFLLMTSVAVVYAESRVSIALKEYVELEKSEFLLADIADISGEDKEIMQQLKDLKIGIAPQYGFSKQYSFQDVERVIRSSYNESLRILWSAQQEVIIKSRGQKVDLSELEGNLKKEVLGSMKNKDDGLSVFNIKHVALNEHIYLPMGTYSFNVVFPKTMKIRSRLTGLIDFYIEDKRVKTTPVTFELEVIRPVYIAKTDLVRRTDVNLSDYEIVRKNVAQFYDEVASIKDDYKNLILTKNKQKFSVLMKPELMKRPLVMKGETTSITVFGEKVKIRSFGVAQNDANQGEDVILMNNEGASFNGVVAGKGEVYVY